jgi:two-component system CheB/CheR fusion protein
MFVELDDESAFHEHAESLQRMFSLIRKVHGVDFSKYKEGTILRRLNKEMLQCKISDLDSYLDYLTLNPIKLNILFQSLLIPVTSFFRDKKTFQVFKREVVPEILSRALRSKSIRIWVPGCSTGEEVYSILICLLETIKNHQLDDIKIQVFGTDVNADALQCARKGKYPIEKLDGISKARLKQFFVKGRDGYKISNVIRNMCLFARHNLLEDPPFLHLDVISCQNVLIYFNSVAQKRVFNLFQAALNPGGYLILGKVEAIPKYLSSLSRYKPRVPIFMKM